MFNDEDYKKPNPVLFDLDPLSIEELEERIIHLNEEITRTQTQLNKKKSSLDAANAFFSSFKS